MSFQGKEPPAEDRLFDDSAFGLELFWERHRKSVIVALALLLIALAACALWLIRSRAHRNAAESLFAQADTPEEWRRVINDYPATMPAANASLLLAESLRNQGNLAESSSTYRKFLETFPSHPLASGALLGIAQNFFAERKEQDAVASLREVQQKGGYGAPFAALLEGRLYVQQGRLQEARKVFTSLLAAYPSSPVSRAAGAQLDEIAGLLAPESRDLRD